MNQWIQGIMLFDFVLKHVPGKTHLAADALSRCPLAEGEEIDDDDEWLDNIALYIGTTKDPKKPFGSYKLCQVPFKGRAESLLSQGSNPF